VVFRVEVHEFDIVLLVEFQLGHLSQYPRFPNLPR